MDANSNQAGISPIAALEKGTERIAVFGGIYSNHVALEALLRDVEGRGIERLYCLGDLGGFGPYPNRVFPLLIEKKIPVIRGNYDDAIGNELGNCQCGYTDPRDNYFARLSYDYTLKNTSAENKKWLRDLPGEIRLRLGAFEVLLCHGSPRRTNEFLWESTTSDAFLAGLCEDFGADIIVVTHTGLHWHREVAKAKHLVNCGAIGRPANDGHKWVYYGVLTVAGEKLSVEFIPLEYDAHKLAGEMRDEGLPEEFIRTIETGWWTTCLEVLPIEERARGIF